VTYEVKTIKALFDPTRDIWRHAVFMPLNAQY